MRKLSAYCAIICIILITSSCSHSVGDAMEISADMPNIRQSMKAYLETDTVNYAAGEYFTAKLIDLAVIENRDRTVYFYHIALAPKTTMPINRIKSIRLLPDPTLDDYFSSSAYPPQGYKEGFGSLQYGPFAVAEDFYALEFTKFIRNNSDAYQKENNFTDEAFDEVMSNVDIEIKFDWRKDLIHLSFSGDVDRISDETDARAVADENIMNILRDGTTRCYLRELAS